MPSAKPITIQVSDIIQWFERNELTINDTFQRHSVWSVSAKTYLIDTILNELPIPKIYVRTLIDPTTQTSVREIVDGQQRLRAIRDFARDELKLTSRSPEFKGLRYSDLDEESQERFLGYTMTAEQLLNASDDDVIDIFARINSYTVSLNAAEKRHATYQTEFKYAVRDASQEFRPFIEDFGVFTTKQRFRMADDSFFAQLFGVILEGVRDGGDPNIRKLYERWDDDEFTSSVQKRVWTRARETIRFFEEDIADVISGHLAKHYQLLMIAAAFLHHRYGIEKGDISRMPDRKRLADSETCIRRLSALEDALEEEEPPKKYEKFVEASASSTHRIASRRTRFAEYVRALAK